MRLISGSVLCAQGSPMTVRGGPYRMLEIELGSATWHLHTSLFPWIPHLQSVETLMNLTGDEL